MRDGRGMDEMQAAYSEDFTGLYGVAPDITGWSFDALAAGITELREERVAAETFISTEFPESAEDENDSWEY